MRQLACLAAFVAAVAGLSAETPQNPSNAPRSAQDAPPPVVLGAAKPLSVAEAARLMSGTWQLNADLSPLPRASTSPQAGAVPDGRGRGGGGARSAGGGRGPVLGQQALAQAQLRVRALYRELTVRPQRLTITAAEATVTFVDDDGETRIVTANNKKEKLDLGTAIVDCRARWDGAALTLELEADARTTLFEIFELSPTGRQILVTLKTPNMDGDPRPGELRGHLQRVYDRVGDSHGSNTGVLQGRADAAGTPPR